MNLLTALMNLQNVIDDETKQLFFQFCVAALKSMNPNKFVKDALRNALEEPAPPPPTQAEVKVEGAARRERRETRRVRK